MLKKSVACILAVMVMVSFSVVSGAEVSISFEGTDVTVDAADILSGYIAAPLVSHTGYTDVELLQNGLLFASYASVDCLLSGDERSRAILIDTMTNNGMVFVDSVGGRPTVTCVGTNGSVIMNYQRETQSLLVMILPAAMNGMIINPATPSASRETLSADKLLNGVYLILDMLN